MGRPRKMKRGVKPLTEKQRAFLNKIPRGEWLSTWDIAKITKTSAYRARQYLSALWWKGKLQMKQMGPIETAGQLKFRGDVWQEPVVWRRR